jgi:PAS domain S-box-containing protein
VTGASAAVTAVPIRGGVVAAFVDLDTTGPQLASLYGGGHPIEFLVTSGNGRTVIARSVHAKRWIGASLADSPFLRFEGNGQHPDVEGRSRIYAETTVPGVGWRFYAGEDSAAALADQHRLERRSFEIIVAGLALALLATFFIYRQVALPIRNLGRAVRSGASSSPPDPVPVTGPTEIAALGKDVNSLIDAVGNELRQRQQTEEELRQLAAIVESSHDAIVGRTLDGVVTSWNAAAETLFGYTAAEMIGRPVESLVPEGQEEVAAISDAIERGKRVQFEAVRVRKDGAAVDVLTTVSPIRDASGAIVGASTISHDIAVRKRLEQELRVSEESYRHLFERHPAPMWLYDPESLAFLAVNEAAVAAYGYDRDEFLAMTIDEIRAVEDRPALREAIADPDRTRVEAEAWRHRKKDGTFIDVIVASNATMFEGRPVRLVLAQDVTEQRQLEAQLRQAQKMEAIGNLAGGIAHDFNNILMVIRMTSALMLRRIEDDATRTDILHIDNAAIRASELTHQLLAFSRQQVLQPEMLDLNAAVDEALGLLHRLLGEHIEIVTKPAPGSHVVAVDRSQLGQVILNLAVNARDAMEPGGTLTIRTDSVTLDEIYAADHVDVKPGKYELLQITDSGPGMDEETQGRVFDPFFTTKANGTGLGLATVYGIVAQSGGHIWLYSEVGLGTTFKIYFPAAGPHSPTVKPLPIAESGPGDETILFVEDDAVLRPLVAAALQSFGYTVLEAASGGDALALSQRNGRIDLLLTDVVMPDTNGRELAERLVADNPHLKVLFTSGYPADTVVRDDIAQMRAAFIEKPYLPEELARKIREVLDASSPVSA